MFERFTKEAKACVVGAQEVARDTGSRQVDTRHLLLSLVERPGPAQSALRGLGTDVATLASEARADLRSGGLDGAALAGLGIDLDAVRQQTDAVFGAGALERVGRSRRGHIPFAPEAKKSLELSLREAIRLKQKSIHGSHLLLGVLRAEGSAHRLLLAAGVDIDALRTAIEEQTRAA